jgi:hypothetical protein
MIDRKEPLTKTQLLAEVDAAVEQEMADTRNSAILYINTRIRVRWNRDGGFSKFGINPIFPESFSMKQKKEFLNRIVSDYRSPKAGWDVEVEGDVKRDVWLKFS